MKTGFLIVAVFSFVLAGILSAAGLRDEEPNIVNARLETRSAAAGLEKEFRALLNQQMEPAWVGYTVPATPHHTPAGCLDFSDDSSGCCRGRCALEGTTCGPVAGSGVVQLEGSSRLRVLLRMEGKQVVRIRSDSGDCQLDAGGLPFIWFTEVRPEQSVALLSSFAASTDFDSRSTRRLGRRALAALALHRDGAADRALEGFVAPERPESLRAEAAFWLGAARANAGLSSLRRMSREDPSARVREKVAFALSRSSEPEALDEMMHMARNDSDGHVRGQALFWLAHKAGTKAAGAITEAIENDPETAVKRRAVFALSRLPKDEGVPLLIQVARTNKNPAVRKQAVFWLGQSNDPRALAFFEEILTR